MLGGASEHGGRRLPMSRFTGEPGSRCRAACERSAPRSLGEKRHLRTCNVEAWHGHAREAAARKHQLVQHLILRPGLQLLLNANGWRVGARGCAGVGLQLLLRECRWLEGRGQRVRRGRLAAAAECQWLEGRGQQRVRRGRLAAAAECRWLEGRGQRVRRGRLAAAAECQWLEGGVCCALPSRTRNREGNVQGRSCTAGSPK